VGNEIQGVIRHEDETLQIMGRYNFVSVPVDLDKVKAHIEGQLENLPKSTVVVLLYLKEA